MAKLNRSERPFRLYRRSLVPRERKIYYADQDFIGLVYSTFSRRLFFRPANNCNLCLHLYPHRDLDSPFHLVVLLLGEVGVVAAARPGAHAVVEVGHVFNVAAGDEGAKALLSREVEVAGVAADGSSAVSLDEMDNPILVELKVHQDAGHESIPGVGFAPRRLAREWTEAATGFLLRDQAVDPAEGIRLIAQTGSR